MFWTRESLVFLASKRLRDWITLLGTLPIVATELEASRYEQISLRLQVWALKQICLEDLKSFLYWTVFRFTVNFIFACSMSTYDNRRFTLSLLRESRYFLSHFRNCKTQTLPCNNKSDVRRCRDFFFAIFCIVVVFLLTYFCFCNILQKF